MDAAFLQARIDQIKIQIVELETAFDALIAGTIVSYELDTGQSKTKVTKMSIATITRLLDALMERCYRYEVRLKGGGTIIAGPSTGSLSRNRRF